MAHRFSRNKDKNLFMARKDVSFFKWVTVHTSAEMAAV